LNRIFLNQRELFPSKVVCIGRNYTEHIKELKNEVPDEMVFFIKPNSSIATTMTFPKNSQTCHYEAEISFLIEEGKINGVGFGLDLTLREVQSTLKAKGLPWERAKSFLGSAVFSDFVSCDLSLNDLQMKLFINDALVQEGSIDLMIHKPLHIIKEFETFNAFEDGDILMTGTPKGVGSFQKGDVFKGQIFQANTLLVEQTFKVN
jgi:2-keto-4-pentenoate hydratase/2-oxohepta-3-ene-1,7-dioic acid hydratase in catechol pathway